MKALILYFLFQVLFGFLLFSQNGQNNAELHVDDTTAVNRLISAAYEYRFSRPDSSVVLARQALLISKKIEYKEGECRALIIAGEELRLGSDYPQALETLFKALQMSRDIQNSAMEANTLDFIGAAYTDLGESRQSLYYSFLAKDINDKLSQFLMESFDLSNIGTAYEQLNMLDSALLFEEQAYQVLQKADSADVLMKPVRSRILRRFGNIQWKLNNYEQALVYYRQVVHYDDLLNTGASQLRIAEYYFDIDHKLDSALFYGLLSYNKSEKSLQKAAVMDASRLLAKIYQSRNRLDSANFYYEKALEIKDTLFNTDKFHKLQLLAINEQQRQEAITRDKERFEYNVRLFFLTASLAIFLILSLIFYRNNRAKRKANRVLETTLKNLRATQSQLIHAEKMASLGQMTAGIAHEIQNPLNFVNNFSEVNRELVAELKNELARGSNLPALEIANDIAENSEKIIQHGKRADAIVKGMLEHSRVSSSRKEMTDLNALAGEYLRLCYHGFCSKGASKSPDKLVDISTKTDFDTSLRKIEVVPQEIGRVLLNLYDNAFYAVHQKALSNLPGYIPTVLISTKGLNGKVEIKVRDNGIGIPQKHLDKIFQPFFTTKPTGQGTGLGLSLSYDIITKGHGGELKVETKEGAGSEFTIQLPSSNL